MGFRKIFKDSRHADSDVLNQVACYAMIEECLDFSCLNIYVASLVSMILLCFVSAKQLSAQSLYLTAQPQEIKAVPVKVIFADSFSRLYCIQCTYRWAL